MCCVPVFPLMGKKTAEEEKRKKEIEKTTRHCFPDVVAPYLSTFRSGKVCRDHEAFILP